MSLWNVFRNMRRPRKTYCVIIDTASNTLVAIGTHVAAMHAASETLMDTSVVPGVRLATLENIVTQDPRTYPEWSWSARLRPLKRTRADLITDDMRDRAALTAKKIEAFSRIIRLISRMREKINTGMIFQHVVYAQKEADARRFKEAGYDERLAPSVLYVTQYAEDRAISLKQAADEILLHAKLDRDFLLTTEKLRMSATRKVKEAKNADEIEGVIEALRKNVTL